VSSQAFAVPSMTSTLSTTSTTAGSKVDLTTQIPAVSATDASTQEIIQTIDPSKVRLTAASDVIAPSGWTVTYSTDGTTFAATPSSWAAVVKIKATGVVNSGGATVDGKQIYSTTASLPGTVTTVDGTARSGGDGYDTEFDSRGYIYNTYHHDYVNGGLDCRKRSDGSFCSANWPMRLGLDGFHSNFSSTQYFDEVYKHLWLPVSDRLTGTGFLCIDVSNVETPVYCGGSKEAAWHMVQARVNASEAGVTDITASNGKVYAWDMQAPRVLCYDYLANNGFGAPCASMPTFSRLVAGSIRLPVNNIPYTYSTFKLAFGNVYGQLNGVAICFNGATMERCTGWAAFDYVLGTNSSTKIMYVQPNAAGGIAGICTTADAQCFAENGTRFAANTTVQAGLTQGWMSYWNGAVEAAGSKLLWTSYFDKPSTTYCYDYATSAPCANWGAATRFISGVGQMNTDAWRIYTLKVDPLSNNCMWTNGDLGQGIKQFTISTATPGCNINVSTVSFAQSAIQPRLACSFGTDVGYRRFTIAGLTPGTDFSTASLTVVKADGSVAVSGGTTWSNIAFNSSGYVDLANLAYADVGAGANFKVTYSNRTTFTATTGTLTMQTKSAELCVSVTANVACPTTTQIIDLPTQITSFSATGSTTSSGGSRIDYSSTSPDLSIAPPANASACGFQLTGQVSAGAYAADYPTTVKPVPGAIATLIDSVGNVLNDTNGNPITATTDASGNYSFGYLKAGTYKVRFADFPLVNGVGAGDIAMVYISPFRYLGGSYVMTPQNPMVFTTIQAPLTSLAITGTAAGADVQVKAVYTMRAVAVNDTVSVKAGATANTIAVLANDTPTNTTTFTTSTLKLCAAGTTSACTLSTLPVANEGTYTVSSGSIVFTPVAAFTGTATPVNYEVKDGYSNTPQTVGATLTVKVIPAPTTAPDTLSGNLQAPITVDVTANDSPATGATLVKSSVKLCSSGTSTNCNQTSVAIAGKGTYSVSALGVVTFTPETAYVGPVPALTYSITDSVGNVATSTVTATVTPTPPTITTPAFPNAAVGVVMPADTQTVTLGNAAIPATGAWVITVGTLPPGLSLNPDTGAITGTPTATGVYSFTVQVTDGNGLTATKVETISVFVGPTITTTPTSYAYYAGTPMSITDTVTAGTGAILPSAAWSATGLPAGVTINTTTGVISGTPTTDGVYPVVVTVTDTNNLSDTETITITVTTKPVITTVSPLPRAIAGVAITTIPQTKTQGTASIPATGAWAITAGALPAGLTVNPDTGEITGTATVTGNFTFTVQLTDAAGEVATKVETISVISGPTITTSPRTYKYYTGTAVTLPNTVTAGTGAILSTGGWSATGLPNGLGINTTTGNISGTPTVAGTFTVTERVTDVNGLFDEETLTITVVTKPVITTVSPLPRAVAGTPVSVPQTSTTGSAAIPATGAWSIVGGSLPPGLSMNPDTGEITGTPTTLGSYSFTVQLVDVDGEVATKVETMSVATPPTITTTPLTYKYYTGTPVTLPNTVTPGSGAILATAAWTASGLPAGLTINTTTGVISGTPTTAGTYTVTERVTDVNTYFDEEVLTIKVVTKPVITTPSPLSQNVVGVAIDPEAQTFTPGSAAIPSTGAWTITVGTLPTGLSMNPDTGAITGTPTAAGDFSFTVKLTDADGEFTTKVETMRVIAGPEITTTPQSYMININEPWTLNETVVRGTGALLSTNAWTFSALPEGLTANRTTGVITGFPKEIGETDVTVTVTDANGLTDTTVITIKVIDPPQITTPRNLGSFELGSTPAPILQTVDLGSAPLIAQDPWTSVIGNAPITSVSPIDGTIVVAPTALGTFTFTATITDENGKTDTATYTLKVVPAGSNITKLTLPAEIVPDTTLQKTSYPLTGLGTSSKNLPVTYSAGPASVCYVDSAKVLQLIGLGKCDVTAQSGTGALLSKDVQSFTVKKSPQTVTIIPPGTTVNGITAPAATDSSSGFKLIAPMSSGLKPVFESLTTKICMVEPDGQVTWLVDASKAGMNTCKVKVTQPGDAAFYALEDSPSNTYDIVATHVTSPAVPATAVATEKPIGTPRTPGVYKNGPWTITITTTKITVLGPVSSGTFIGPVIAVTKIPYTVVVKGKKVNKIQVCTIKFGLEKPFKKTDPLAWKNRITKPSVPCTLNAEAYAFYKAGNSVKLTTVVTRDRRWPTTNLNRVGDDGKGKLIPKIVSNWKISIG
jgi:CshA-type fibril repeat protein